MKYEKEVINQKRKKSRLQNIKLPCVSREGVIKLFNDYRPIASEVIFKSVYGEGIKILTRKQMLQRLLIPLSQVKASNTSENLLNEIRQYIYIPCIEPEKLLKNHIII